MLYEGDQPLNTSFSEELSIYYENESITEQLPEGFTFLDSEATISSTKPLELTLDESTINTFDISNVSIENEFKFRVDSSANYTINYVVHMEVIQILGLYPSAYVPLLQIALTAVGIFSTALLVFELEQSET